MIRLKNALLYPLLILIVGTLIILAINGFIRTKEAAEDLTYQALNQALSQSQQQVAESIKHKQQTLIISAKLLKQALPLTTFSPNAVKYLNQVSDQLETSLTLTFFDTTQIQIQQGANKQVILKDKQGKLYKHYITPSNQTIAKTEIQPNSNQSDQAFNWHNMFKTLPVNTSRIQYKNDQFWIHYHFETKDSAAIISTQINTKELVAITKQQIKKIDYADWFLTVDNLLTLQTQINSVNTIESFNTMKLTTHDKDPDMLLINSNVNLDTNQHWQVHLSMPRWRMAENLTRNLTDTLMQTLLVLIAITFLIVIIATTASRPLKELTQKVELLRVQRYDDVKKKKYKITEYQLIEDALESLKNRYLTISKYIPTPLIDKLDQADSQVEIHGESKHLNILTTNITGFTRLTKDLQPEQLVHYLSFYQSTLYDILTERKGIIDQNSGDHILGYWGAPVSQPNDPILACQAALQIDKALAELNALFIELNYPQFQHKTSIVSGDTIVGNFGSLKRMIYSVIGASVEDVKFINQLNTRYGTKIIICEETYLEVKDTFFTRKLDRITTDSGSRSRYIYELICWKNDPMVHNMLTFVAQYETALDQAIAGRTDTAEASFLELMNLYPDDEASIYQMGKLFQVKQNKLI